MKSIVPCTVVVPRSWPSRLSELWLFGYGSLIWNPGFEHSQSCKAILNGWSLRFWQASLDHRGTPEHPGRVATIVPLPGDRVSGRAYCIEGDRDSILSYLDHREKGGYTRVPFEVETDGGLLSVFSYVGLPDSPQFIGPEDETMTASVISRSVGPSGRNRDYLVNLYQALIDLGDPPNLYLDRLIELLD